MDGTARRSPRLWWSPVLVRQGKSGEIAGLPYRRSLTTSSAAASRPWSDCSDSISAQSKRVRSRCSERSTRWRRGFWIPRAGSGCDSSGKDARAWDTTSARCRAITLVAVRPGVGGKSEEAFSLSVAWPLVGRHFRHEPDRTFGIVLGEAPHVAALAAVVVHKRGDAGVFKPDAIAPAVRAGLRGRHSRTVRRTPDPCLYPIAQGPLSGRRRGRSRLAGSINQCRSVSPNKAFWVGLISLADRGPRATAALSGQP